jgi:hypothetical protein
MPVELNKLTGIFVGDRMSGLRCEYGAMVQTLTGRLAPLRFKGETVIGCHNRSGELVQIAFRSDG